MVKKKNSKQKRQKDFADTSDEEINDISSKVVEKCPHTTKAVNFTRVKKSLKVSEKLDLCLGCNASQIEFKEKQEILLCLQCGYHGCGEKSKNRHALQHNKTLHSDSHALALNMISGIIWCYDCNEEIDSDSSPNLKQCIEFIMKFKLKDISKILSKKTQLSNSSQVQQNASEKEDNLSVEKKISSEIKKPVENTAKFVKNARKENLNSTMPLVKGLRNLGNTCFFNAVMQNLSHTSLLLYELELSERCDVCWEVPQLVVEDNEILEDEQQKLKVTLPPLFPLAHSLLNFLRQMNTASSSRIEIVNPSVLFGEISKKSPQFRHFDQQDSHELLRHLLDGIRQEEIKRHKKGILQAFNLENVSPENVDENVKKLIKGYGSYASHTIVEKIFGGLLISTVLCEECKMSSQVFEPFMDLSLPLFEEKPGRNRKFDKESDDENNEYIIKSKKESPNKLSKYQEKKLKQQARKDKKKIKKSKKNSIQNLNCNSDNELEEAGKNEEVEFSDQEDKLKQENESDNIVKNEELLNGLPQNSLNENSLNPYKINEEIEKENNVSEESLNEVKVNLEDLINHSETKTLDNEEDDIQNKDILDEDIKEGSESFNNSLADSHSFDDRMQALCLQVKDIRIRRDSDKQENILNLSHNEEGESQPSNDASNESMAEDSNENKEAWSQCFSEKQTKEWIMRSLMTLKPRNHPPPLECSITSCLSHFTKSELLTGSNKFRCESCTERKRKMTGVKSEIVYTNASKQMLIFSPPAVLTLHLKRFQQTGMSLKKVNRFVEFPLVLDLAQYCSSASLILPHMSSVKDELLYSLYGIVEHSGRLSSGHYTAFVKVSKRTIYPSFMNHLPLIHCDLEELLHKFSRINPTKEKNSEANNFDSDYRWYYISDNHVKEVSESHVLKCQAYLLFYQRIK